MQWNRNKPTFAASSWDSGAQGGLASWSKVAGAEEAKDRSTAWDGSGSRRGLEEVAASQLNCSKTPADRLKQLAARSRSEKLRAAAQQLKETATSGGHLVSTIPECQQSLHSTVVQPAVAGISDDDLDLLLDDINSGLLPDNLPTQGADRRSLYPSRTSSSLGKPRALQALAFAEDDIGSQEPSPASLDVRAKDRQAAHVEAGVQADAVAPASFSSPQEPAGSVDSWADAATEHLGSLEARLPQPSLQAAAAAMQNRLERLRSSLSALDGGLPANQPVAPCGVALAQHIAAAKVAIKDQQGAALSSYNPRLEAGQQDPQARRLSAALVVTQAPKPVSAAAAATLDEAQKPQAHPPRLEEGQPAVPPKQDTVSGPADAKAGAEQPRLEPCYQASLAVVELTDTSGPLRPPVDDGAALVAGGTAPRQSTMWSPSMNQLVDDVLDELFFHGDSSAPLALPAPASPDPAHANAQPALGLAKEQLPSRLS
ncbi:hypothetical protein N2152v2_002544 [Parachlorella kessleri]